MQKNVSNVNYLLFANAESLGAETADCYRKLFGSFHYSISVIESRSKKTLASAKKSGFQFEIKVSKFLLESDFRLAVVTSVLLLGRINRKKIPPELVDEYKVLSSRYFSENAETFEVKSRKSNYSGVYFNLEKIFDDVINQHGLIFAQGTKIQWSQKNSVRRVGYFVEKDDLIVISKVLDHPSVPVEVVEFIVYHELLHKLLGTEHTSSRRIVHGKRFNELEKKFYKFKEADHWLNYIYPKFLRKITI